MELSEYCVEWEMYHPLEITRCSRNIKAQSQQSAMAVIAEELGEHDDFLGITEAYLIEPKQG